LYFSQENNKIVAKTGNIKLNHLFSILLDFQFNLHKFRNFLDMSRVTRNAFI